MTESDALQLLKDTSWFGHASDAFLEELCKLMEPHEIEKDHVLQREGEKMKEVYILERGRLVRTKKFDDKDGESSHGSSHGSSNDDDSIIVDHVYGRGRVVGLLHIIKPLTSNDIDTTNIDTASSSMEKQQQQYSAAFATVRASEASKVWSIPGADFCQLAVSQPQYALDLLQAMARELRSGSKSLRTLMKDIKRKGQNQQDGDNESVGGEGKTCRILCYDATSWVTKAFEPAIEEFNKSQQEEYEKDNDYEMLHIEMDFTSERLSEQSAVYAASYDAVCLFVNDNANSNVMQTLSQLNVKLIAMRCAGYDRIDTDAARAYGITVARVPAYSPYAVAEMAVSLLMAVNRKIAIANNRVRMANFTLDAGLLGFDVHGKTVGVMGTGKIGQILCQIMSRGFGANLICYDVSENKEVVEMGGKYVESPDDIFEQSDVIFLMMPLLPATRHTINDKAVEKLKEGVIIINTSRGALIDTTALLKGLQSGKIGGVGMDVYENEAEYFFQDYSSRHIKDPELTALMGHHDVVLTAHQAFFTQEAVDKIVSTTLENIYAFSAKGKIGQRHPNNCVPDSKSKKK